MTPQRQLAGAIIAAIGPGKPGRKEPLIVAIDGPSGAGKSSLAVAVARAIAESSGRSGEDPPTVAVIEGDDFYAGGDAQFWDSRSAEQKVAHCIDWRRQRSLLTELRQRGTATWFPFDWEAFDGRLAATPLSCGPADVVILEGAYSARPELADLVDLRVLLDTSADECQRRLRAREGAEYQGDWEGRWREAEHHYFGVVMGRSAFDLVLDGDRQPPEPG